MADHRITGVTRVLFGVLLATLGGTVIGTGCTIESSDSDGKGGSGGEDSTTGGTGASTTANTGGKTTVTVGGATGQATTSATSAAGNGTVNAGVAGSSTVGTGVAGSSAASTGGVANVAGAAGSSSVTTGGQTGSTVASSDHCAGADPGNNTRETSTVLALGSTYLACLQASADVDFYEFTAPANPAAGGVVQLSIIDVETTGNIETTVYVVADNGQLVGAYASGVGTNVYSWFNAHAGSSYRIAVKHFTSASKPTAYTLKTNFVAVNDTHEPNDVRTQPGTITVGTQVQGYFFAGYKMSTGFETNAWQDWYKVNLAAGSVTATLNPMASDVNAQFSVYNNLFADVPACSGYESTSGGAVVKTCNIPNAGEYYIMVTPFTTPVVKGTGSVIPQYTTLPYSLTVTQP